MCGIAGYYKFGERIDFDETEILRQMIRGLEHRGPDDEGMYSDDYVALGFRRLSIIDIAGGHQPIFNEDKSVALIFNGEIYNYRELRNELIGKGHRFNSNCDSEVIVHLYEQEKTDFVRRLDGMFAICLWDAKRKLLILVRDRMGKKPVYYFCDNKNFAFASEIKAILKNPHISKVVDEESLALYLALNYVPAPKTIYRNIFKIPAGCMLVVNKYGVSTNSYWALSDYFSPKGIEDDERKLIPDLREKFFRAVEKRLMSDVPLGVLLSGGIDSSSIVAALAELGATDIPTFSVVFRKYRYYNEEKYSKIVASHFNTNHTVLNADSDYLDLIEKVVYQMDEPVADKALIPSYMIFEKASRDVKVILSGEGADELFCGYNKYKYLRFVHSSGCFSADFIEKIIPYSRKMKKVAELVFAKNSMDKIILWDRVFLGSEYQKLINKSLLADLKLPDLFNTEKRYSFIEKMMIWDLLSYLPENLLMKVDKLSMAHGLEARAPYLDVDLVKTAMNIPVKIKVKAGNAKLIQKKMFANYLPAEIINRPKHGFTFPVKDWIKNDTSAIVSKYLNNQTLSKSVFLNKEYVNSLILRHRKGIQDHTRQIWNLITWQAWAKTNGFQ